MSSTSLASSPATVRKPRRRTPTRVPAPGDAAPTALDRLFAELRPPPPLVMEAAEGFNRGIGLIEDMAQNGICLTIKGWLLQNMTKIYNHGFKKKQDE